MTKYHIGDIVKIVGNLEDWFTSLIWEVVAIQTYSNILYYKITNAIYGKKYVQENEIARIYYSTQYDLGI